MRRVLVPLAALGLALVTACGGPDAEPEPAATAAPAVADTQAKFQQMENIVADCMKQQGFQYVPRPPATGDDQQGRFTGPLSVLESPNEVRAFRAKYGFGVFARFVYPDDPAVAPPKRDAGDDPNEAIRSALDPARRKAYDLALNGNQEGVKGKAGLKEVTGEPGCGGKASIEVFGDGAPDEAAAQNAQRAYAAFQTDPEVVAAAQKYADCLRGQGYKVTTTRPGEVEDVMNSAAIDGRLPAQPGPDDAKVPVAGAVTAAVAGDTTMDPETAKAGLQTEIKAALADLDCRTDYALIVRTEHAATVAAGNGQG